MCDESLIADGSTREQSVIFRITTTKVSSRLGPHRPESTVSLYVKTNNIWKGHCSHGITGELINDVMQVK